MCTSLGPNGKLCLFSLNVARKGTSACGHRLLCEIDVQTMIVWMATTFVVTEGHVLMRTHMCVYNIFYEKTRSALIIFT